MGRQIDNNSIATIIIDVILLALLIGLSFELGMDFSELKEKRYITVGCWQRVANTNRSIAIRVDDQTIEEIMSVESHELCHEIYWRELTNKSRFSSQASESFAETCTPEDYIYLEDE